MKKVIKVVDVEQGIMQVTCPDERWYVKDIVNKTTGLPEYQYVPSVTWILAYYPKGPQLMKWIAAQGWDEAEAVKKAAGDKGSKVHLAIAALIAGYEVRMEGTFPNPSTGLHEELTVDEWDCLCAFERWYKSVNPTVKASEIVVWNTKHNYAGTIDLVCTIDGQDWIIDFKTGQGTYPEHALQISAYKHAYTLPNARLAILQIGYKRNKDRYKFTEVDDQFPLFLATQAIWANETKGTVVEQKNYPLTLSLAPAAPAAEAESEPAKEDVGRPISIQRGRTLSPRPPIQVRRDQAKRPNGSVRPSESD